MYLYISKEDDEMEFGKKIQYLRKENKISQERLAEKINVSRQAISKWEQGASVPDTDNIVQLSRFFQVPIEYLLLDEYDFVYQVESVQKQETMPQTTKKENPGRLIFIGVLLEIEASCFSYVLQYCDLKVKDGCYTNAMEYLKHFPLILIVIMGIICICAGGYTMAKNR